MGNKLPRLLVISIVAIHLLMLAAYTFPERMVPERLRFWGQWYARPLFHQQWKLFAPDPPTCSCTLEWQSGSADWTPMATDGMHYLERRMVYDHCLWLAEGYFGAEWEARPALIRLADTDEAAAPRFRIVQGCIADPKQPAQREDRIILLYGP